MGFMIGLAALIAAFFTWQFRFDDVAFDAYVKSKLGAAGAKWKIVFWFGVGFAAWALVTFRPEPAYVALLINLLLWVLWLSSEAGQKWLKSLT